MENFNSRFKNKKLRSLAWGIAEAKTERDFRRRVGYIADLNQDAYNWMEDIGFERISKALSPVCRYDILKSNNVECVNSRILKRRKFPILEMLQSIEKMIVTERFERLVAANSWKGPFTRYAREKLLGLAEGKQIFLSSTQTSEQDYLITYSKNAKKTTYKVCFSETAISYTCGVLVSG